MPNLDPDHQRQLDAILTTSPELRAMADRLRGFADIMRHRRGRDLEKSMTTVDIDDQPSLHSIIRGLRRSRTPSPPDLPSSGTAVRSKTTSTASFCGI